MRRHDKACTDPDAIAQVLDTVEWGVLGLATAGGTPLLVPMNFVPVDGRLYFHSAPAGEKIDTIQNGTEATFLVVNALAPIPSTAFGPDRACTATQYYQSVILYGQVAPVTDPDRKAAALDALMRKLQPEGGYRPITASDPMYQASVQGVTILEMTVDRVSAQFETGKRLTPEDREGVVKLLEARGSDVDRRTLRAMGIGWDRTQSVNNEA
jgi:hypothetical protein